MRATKWAQWCWLLVALLLILASSLLALQVGASDAPVWQWWLAPGNSGERELAGQLLWQVRAPRAVLALLVGAALGLAGGAMQGLLRNPLAEPGIIGVSGGAAFCSVLVLYFGIAAASSWWLPLSAVLGSCMALALVLLLAGVQSATTTLILAGVACSAIFSSGIALLLNLAPNPFAMQELSFWLLGSVAHRDWSQVTLVLPGLAVGAVLLTISGRYWQALTLGEEAAASLGFSHRQYRLGILLAVALLVGSSVAVAGMIGFVGLMAPHLIRRLVAGDPRRVLIGSALMGALLVLWADMAVQLLSGSAPLQLGVVTGLLGGPFFLVLLLKQRWQYA